MPPTNFEQVIAGLLLGGGISAIWFTLRKLNKIGFFDRGGGEDDEHS